MSLKKHNKHSNISLSQIPVAQFRANGGGGGGGGDDEPQEPQTQQQQQQMAKQRAAQSDNIWELQEMKRDRAKVKIWSFLALLTLVLPIVMMIITVLKALPGALLDYGGIYFLVFIPGLVLNIITASKRIRSLYILALALNSIVMLLVAWILFVIIYQLVGCYDGTLLLSCRDVQVVQWIALGATMFLLLFMFLAFIRLIVIVYRLTANPRARL
jgi:hypothetical protein